ncbi:DUF2474 domain-containing protein [Aureimonas fodinaquatilis]|uniref:DUF2474 domain-containing protein n=1 Tax=Aureimonas fodinaquatilis TaxID=2565783 RepID=A0A5B0E210_9HYPH|nr:DUF2474 domain-containing protein [Aureimonas fodinaquatilis]KAA0972698.1 DUF2474 domain-containing protein [Aureimonas fodinaquatilis]
MARVPLQRTSTAPKSWVKRVGWLVLIWVVSVTALGTVAYLFRFLMKLAGLSL